MEDKITGEILATDKESSDGNWHILLWLENGSIERIAKPEIVEQLKELGLTERHDSFVYENHKIRRWDYLKDNDLEIERFTYKFNKMKWEETKDDYYKNQMDSIEKEIKEISEYRGISFSLEEE